MGKKITNVETYLFILFGFAILVSGLSILGSELIQNDNANLDNDSIEYIATINGIDLSEYNSTIQDQENPVLITGNESSGNPKDDSLDFLFAKEKGFDIELTIKRIFGLPKFVLVDLLRLPLGQWGWLINIIGWLLGATVVIALVYFVRGLIDR